MICCDRRIYYAAIAFSTIAVIASFFVKDISHMMTDNVAVTLKNDERGEKKDNAARETV
jgi:hypothetical protein